MKTGTPIYEPFLAGPDDDWDIPIVDQSQVAGGLKFFETEAAMNTWGTKYVSRRERTVAFVFQNDADGVPQAFLWSNTKFAPFELGTQSIPTPGISIVNPDGSTTTGIELLGLQGLTLEGNEKDGFNLKVTGSGGITFEERNNYAEYNNISRVLIGPYLELNALRDKSGGPVTGVEVGLKPGMFELRKSPGYLAYAQYPELVYGKAKEGQMYRKGTLWFDLTRVSPNGMLQVDKPNKAIGLQDTSMTDDPNVSGGSKFLIWPFIYLEGTAPDDGYVELIWYKKSDGTIAIDMNGHPMAVRHNYKQGQVLTPSHEPIMFAQPLAAKGLTEYCLAVVDNFDDYVKVLDYSEGPSGICIQELSDSGTTSEALLQAEADTGFDVRMERYYVGTYLEGINYLTSIPEPSRTITAGSFANTVAGIEMYAITDLEYAISQGMIQVAPHNGNITDFYIALKLSPEVTRMVAGQELDVSLALQDKDDAWDIGFFTYDGDPDKRPPIFNSRNNNMIVLNSGWTQFGKSFISEDAVSGLHSFQSVSPTVPKDANQVFVAIYPVTAQDPCDLFLRDFHVDASKPAEHISVNKIDIKGLQHLDFMTRTTKLEQGIYVKDAMTGKMVNTGMRGLRYTDNNAAEGIPMPFGVPTTPLKYLHLDKTLNVIAGSAATGGEGGLVADEPVEVTLYQKWQLYNELAVQHEATYWLEVTRDGTGVSTEVPNSRTTFSVDPKRNGVDYFTTNTVTVRLQPGDYLTVRSSSDVKDGAYAQTMQASKPLCITYITEKYLG